MGGGAPSNPIADTELPSWRLDQKKRVRAPSRDEVLLLLGVAGEDDIRFGTFIRLLLATGMRRGEACALRWLDVHEARGTVTVDESVVAANGGAIVRQPKTAASVRTVALDVSTLGGLRQLRLAQAELSRHCAATLSEDGFVFSFEPGGVLPPYPDVMSHSFSRLRSKAGVPADVHLHSLRHFHATVLDAVISEAQKQARMGWSTVQMARHYTDAVAEEDRRAAEHVGRVLGYAGDAADEPVLARGRVPS